MQPFSVSSGGTGLKAHYRIPTCSIRNRNALAPSSVVIAGCSATIFLPDKISSLVGQPSEGKRK